MSYNRAAGGVGSGGRPVRRTLAEELRESILQDYIVSGVVPEGAYLPTEYELVDRYGMSRITVRTALSTLQDAGYIHRQQGRGSLVLPRAQTLYWGLEQLRSIETYAATQGRKVTSTGLNLYQAPIDQTTASRLGRKIGEEAVFIERAKVFDGVIACWIVDVVPVDVVPLEHMEQTFQGSVLDVLLADAQLGVGYSDCELEAVNVDAPLAKHLAVAEGTAAFFIDELTRSGDGHVLNWSRAWALPSHFNFNLRRKL